LRKTFADVDDVAVACVYFNHKTQITRTEIVGNLLKQLLERNTLLSKEAQNVYESHCQRDTRPTFSELSGLLKSEASRFSSFFIVVDALDECGGGEDTADAILKELKALPTSRFMITGRPSVANVISRFGTVPTLEIRAADEDIRKSLKTDIENSVCLSTFVHNDETLQHTITDTIVKNAQGM
jgi:hypothetical protein